MAPSRRVIRGASAGREQVEQVGITVPLSWEVDLVGDEACGVVGEDADGIGARVAIAERFLVASGAVGDPMRPGPRAAELLAEDVADRAARRGVDDAGVSVFHVDEASDDIGLVHYVDRSFRWFLFRTGYQSRPTCRSVLPGFSVRACSGGS